MSPDEKTDAKEQHQTNGIHNEETGSGSIFIEKVLEIPTISDIHNFAKENKYGKIGFQMVGSAGNIVSNVTKPFQNQIRQADKLAADSVCYVGDKFPFVKQPTSEIVDNLKKPALQTITVVKSYQETFGNTIDNKCITPAYSIASNVQSQINERAVGPTITMAKRVDASLTGVVNKFESTLNTYLPEDQENTTERSTTTTETDKNSAELLQTFRAINIALAGQRRLTRRVKAHGNQLQESSALLKSATETVTKLNQMLLSIAVNVREFFEERYTEIVKEIKDGEGTSIEKARNVIQLTTQHTIPLLNDLQGSFHSYSSSLNHSLLNTTEKVKSRFIGVTN